MTVYWTGTAETGSAPAEGSSGDSEWQLDGGGGRYASGDATIALATTPVKEGSRSWRLTINTPSSPSSGLRLFRWDELYAHRDVWCSAWFYFPNHFKLTHDPNSGRYWNMFQFKSIQGGNNDPMWYFGPYAHSSNGQKAIAAYWGNSSVLIAGPESGDDISGKFYENPVFVPIPIRRWVHFEAHVYQSSATGMGGEQYDGIVQFYQDGVQLFDFQNVRTSYYNTSSGAAWNTLLQWAVNLYSDGICPNPYSIYIDDARIASSQQYGS